MYFNGPNRKLKVIKGGAKGDVSEQKGIGMEIDDTIADTNLGQCWVEFGVLLFTLLLKFPILSHKVGHRKIL